MSEKNQIDFALAVKNLRENMPAMLELNMMQAALAFRFNSDLRKQGFTDAQSLELTKARSF